jgi:hypothetical protein
MSGAHEMLEKMEHAGHAGGGHGDHGGGHGGGGPGKLIGITMAVLGVMLAFCAAMVGSARTELIKSTVEQSNLWSVYQSESTKYRIMEADYEMLHALTPNKAEVKKFEEKLASVKRAGGKADDEDTAELKEAIHVATSELADVLTPDKEDEERIEGLAKKYKHDMEEAKEDAESYDEAIDAQHEASEWYERAQLCAEIGIVIASIALLLSSRGVWLISVIIGLGGGGIIGYTYLHTRTLLAHAEHKIEEAKKRTAEIEGDDDKDDDGKPDEKNEKKGEGEAKKDGKPGGEGEKADKKDEHDAPKPGAAPNDNDKKGNVEKKDDKKPEAPKDAPKKR